MTLPENTIHKTACNHPAAPDKPSDGGKRNALISKAIQSFIPVLQYVQAKYGNDPHLDKLALAACPDLEAAVTGVAALSATHEPSAGRAAALEEGDLNSRLKAKGMYSIDEVMGSLPLDKWRVHSGMTDLKFFGEWLERKTRDYYTMRAAYEVGDKDESDELYEWVLAHYGAFHDVLVNFRAALSSPDHADAGKVEGDGVERKFQLGDRVTKNKGSSWTGRVVGFYSTELTPTGYAVESETEIGSVQIYPEAALCLAPSAPASEGAE